MIKFKLYRFIRFLLGATSFVKQGEGKTATYILVKGDYTKARLMKTLTESGFVEEWPIEDHKLIEEI